MKGCSAMEIRKLTESDYDELLELLNSVFANKYGREMDFLSEQPKMWRRDDEHMSRHTAVFEDGKMVSVVGVYPLPTVIAGEELLFATTGNVATRPEYEGRGYFTKLFSDAMNELTVIGADAARLGGSRSRYSRFGYEMSGSSINFEFNAEARKKHFPKEQRVYFRKIEADDSEALEFIDALIKNKPFHVKRRADELLAALHSKHATPYLALIENEPIGYLSATANGQFVGHAECGNRIVETGYKSAELLAEMISSWQSKLEKTVTFSLAPHEKEAVRLFCETSFDFILSSPSHFKIINYEKIAGALMKLKDSYEPMERGEGVIEIEDYGKIIIYKNASGAGCERTSLPADITLSKAKATRLLFGPLSPAAVADVPTPLKVFLPLPLSWNTLDYV